MFTHSLADFRGGISDYYRTGLVGQYASSSNIDSYSFPDGFKLDNVIEEKYEITGEPRCGLDMEIYGKKAVAIGTDNGQIWFDGAKIQDVPTKKYRGCFFAYFTVATVEKKGAFFIHFGGVDRLEWTGTSFSTFTQNVFTFTHANSLALQFPVVNNNSISYFGVNDQVYSYDNTTFTAEVKLKKGDICTGLSEFSDNVFIYSTNGFDSLFYIWDPINDIQSTATTGGYPRTIVEWKGLPVRGISTVGDYDWFIGGDDDIYTRSGTQKQLIRSYWDNVIIGSRKLNGICTNVLDDSYFGTDSEHIYAILQPYQFTPQSLVRFSVENPVNAKIHVLIGANKRVSVCYKNNGKYYLGEISRIGGDKVASKGYIESNFIPVGYKKTSIEMMRCLFSLEGPFAGKIIIYGRISVDNTWTKIKEITSGKSLLIEKGEVSHLFPYSEEYQYKIELERGTTGKSPIFYSLYTEYGEATNA